MRVHWEAIQKLARAHQIEEPTVSVEAFTRFLEFWWCRKYNRPLKDPLLKEYTLDELCYEFLRHFYSDPEHDPKKELQAKKVLEEEDAWIKSQLSKMVQQPQASTKKIEAKVDVKEPPAAMPPDISTKF